MHTPDGFITGWICIAMLLASLSALAYALVSLRKTLDRSKILKMSLLGLVIFAAQMLNFPIASGTSGHLIGAALAAIILGPHAAVVVLAAVLLTQSIVFGDGGMLAIGVNVFNMAVVGSYSAYFVYKRFEGTLGVLLASWTSVLLASVSASVLLAMSGLAPVIDVLAAMSSVHVLIGIGEAFITIGILAYLSRLPQMSKIPHYVAATAGPAFVLLALALPFVSSAPDGMEAVALNMGFYENAVTVYNAPFSEYLVIGSEFAAGIMGMIVVFAALFVSLSPLGRSMEGSAIVVQDFKYK